MRAELLHFAVLHVHDAVAVHDGAQTVGDGEHRAVVEQQSQGGLDISLGLGVQGTGGFVEDDNRRVLEEAACDADALLLSAGETHALFAYHGVEPQKAHGGLASAGGPHDGQRVPLGHREAEIAQNNLRTPSSAFREAKGHILELDHRQVAGGGHVQLERNGVFAVHDGGLALHHVRGTLNSSHSTADHSVHSPQHEQGAVQIEQIRLNRHHISNFHAATGGCQHAEQQTQADRRLLHQLLRHVQDTQTRQHTPLALLVLADHGGVLCDFVGLVGVVLDGLEVVHAVVGHVVHFVVPLGLGRAGLVAPVGRNDSHSDVEG
ncbi:IS481 family protein, putative [Babesia ovata]|uniref:IS481 family protein, putative n=1 Tax=Babesia ovata TaxID=189622 RepID=A0A2H6KDM0_9APIC|nr:IS481 family protein, putative [Babesia ovata]GBE61086.1 IS481 family protein, putative [Babesia ovata]